MQKNYEILKYQAPSAALQIGARVNQQLNQKLIEENRLAAKSKRVILRKKGN